MHADSHTDIHRYACMSDNSSWGLIISHCSSGGRPEPPKRKDAVQRFGARGSGPNLQTDTLNKHNSYKTQHN